MRAKKLALSRRVTASLIESKYAGTPVNVISFATISKYDIAPNRNLAQHLIVDDLLSLGFGMGSAQK